MRGLWNGRGGRPGEDPRLTKEINQRFEGGPHDPGRGESPHRLGAPGGVATGSIGGHLNQQAGSVLWRRRATGSAPTSDAWATSRKALQLGTPPASGWRVRPRPRERARLLAGVSARVTSGLDGAASRPWSRLARRCRRHTRGQPVWIAICRGLARSAFGSRSRRTPFFSVAWIRSWSIVSESVKLRWNVPA